MVNTYSLTVEEYFWFRCAFLDVEGDCFESLHHRNQVLQTQELWSLKQRQTRTIRDDIPNGDTHAHVTQYMYCLTRNFGGRKFWQNAWIACWICFGKRQCYTLFKWYWLCMDSPSNASTCVYYIMRQFLTSVGSRRHWKHTMTPLAIIWSSHCWLASFGLLIYSGQWLIREVAAAMSWWANPVTTAVRHWENSLSQEYVTSTSKNSND